MSKLLCFRNIANVGFRGGCKVQNDVANVIPNRQVCVTSLLQHVTRDGQQDLDHQNPESQRKGRNKKVKPPSLYNLWKDESAQSSQHKYRTKPDGNITKQKIDNRKNKPQDITIDRETPITDSVRDKPYQDNHNSTGRGHNSDQNTGNLRVKNKGVKVEKFNTFKPLSLPRLSEDLWTDNETYGIENTRSKHHRQGEVNLCEEGTIQVDWHKDRMSRKDEWTKQLETFKKNLELNEKEKK